MHGGRVLFVCCAARQMLQVKLPQRGNPIWRGSSWEWSPSFFFLFLFFGSWLWCWTRFFMALDARKCLWSNQLFRQQQPSRNALVFCSRLCVWELKALKGGKGVCLNVKCRAFFLGKSLLVFLYAFQLKAESEHAYVWGRAHICAHTVAQVGKKHSCGSHRRNFWWRQQY